MSQQASLSGRYVFAEAANDSVQQKNVCMLHIYLILSVVCIDLLLQTIQSCKVACPSEM